MKYLTPVGTDLENHINESRNTILYSFLLKDLLKTRTPIIKSKSDKEYAVYTCIENTAYILTNCIIPHIKNHQYFGMGSDGLFNDDFESFYDLGYSLFLSNGFDGWKDLGKDFFISSLINHVVVSSYDIVSCLCSGSESTSLTQLSSMNLSGINSDIDADSLNRENSRLSQRIDSHIQVFRDLNMGDIFSIEKHSIPSVQFPLFKKLILDIEADKLRRGFGVFGNCSKSRIGYYNQCWDDYLELYNSCLKMPKGTSSADRILNKYRVENVFSKTLLCTTVDMLCKLETANARQLSGSNDIAILSLSSRLPNIFSRDIYTMYALSYLAVADSFYIDNHFFDDTRVLSNSPSRSTFTVQNWLIKFKQFCTYYSDFLIPLAQWIFFILLEAALSPANKNNKYGLYLDMKKSLSKYLNDNAELILNPLKEYPDISYNSQIPLPPITAKNRSLINCLMEGYNLNTSGYGVWGMELNPYNISHGSLLSIENISKEVLSSGTRISAELPYKEMYKSGLVIGGINKFHHIPIVRK